jgi:O-acetyl-ADP-ribose deacetylase (regulator of RNase III)
VIHAVGPEFKESQAVLPQQLLLYNAVYNSFKAADSLTCKSIAIPAISSGIYAFPVSLCAQIIFSAIHNFIKEQQNRTDSHAVFLKHFRVVNFDKPTTEFMQAEFEFICETSIPSLEFDICKEIDRFKSILNKKLDKEAHE